MYAPPLCEPPHSECIELLRSSEVKQGAQTCMWPILSQAAWCMTKSILHIVQMFPTRSDAAASDTLL